MTLSRGGPGPARPVRLAILGVGKIARDQHIPTLRANPDFELVACASRNAQVDGVANFTNLAALLDGVADVDAVAICSPPQTHYEAARLALERGKHVLLEKPPCATTAELDQLAQLAAQAGLTLFQTWHSQHAAAVEATRLRLASADIRKLRITWKEDVRQWHPGQAWIWQAGGFGVFDPGINAISILTRILAQPVFARAASLFVPANCEAPIAAQIAFEADGGIGVTAEFDFRHTGVQTWDIEIETGKGVLRLAEGGGVLFENGKRVPARETDGEYASLYRRFAQLIAARTCEVDSRPFQLVADIFLIGKRYAVEPFEA